MSNLDGRKAFQFGALSGSLLCVFWELAAPFLISWLSAAGVRMNY